MSSARKKCAGPADHTAPRTAPDSGPSDRLSPRRSPPLTRTAPPGLLITFAQFLLTASAAYITQLAPGRGTGASSSLPSPPLSTWARISALHFGINILNNWAFAYAISLPVHIILRSTGSVWSMLVGAARGKRYSRLQVGSVLLLTAGVLVSAWAESQAKVGMWCGRRRRW